MSQVQLGWLIGLENMLFSCLYSQSNYYFSLLLSAASILLFWKHYIHIGFLIKWTLPWKLSFWLPGCITKSGCDPVRCTWVSTGLKFWLQNQSAKTYLACGIHKPYSIPHISFCNLKMHYMSFQGMIAWGLSRKEGPSIFAWFFGSP